MSTHKIISAHGVFTSMGDVSKFITELTRSELFKKLARKTEFDYKGQTFYVILHVRKDAKVLLKQSFSDGPLKIWGQNFKPAE